MLDETTLEQRLEKLEQAVSELRLTQLEQTVSELRLTQLEQAVSELQNKVDRKPNANNWVDNLIGSISDEEAFLEALEYGRNFRKTGKFEIEEDNSVSEQDIPGDIPNEIEPVM
ncbi:hypothetical protein [Baaleninema simplex]|uniref:hypothetical protein n=1 Tax=Baaleninema simplex TaxID=2862350 RepID=UPI000348AA61|nr:hypothetical protein [Baaleninema simplex]